MVVLGIGCHPDDLECCCGGTLRKYVEQGADVYMCHVANGDQGHVIIEPGPLAALRTLEAENAGKILGAKEVFNLNVSDMQVNRHDQSTIDAVADVIRTCSKYRGYQCGVSYAEAFRPYNVYARHSTKHLLP